MTDSHRLQFTTGLQIAQTLAILLGVAGLFLTLGRKDQVLETNAEDIVELREIASDLARASTEATMTNRAQDRRLDEIRDRLTRLELPR